MRNIAQKQNQSQKPSSTVVAPSEGAARGQDLHEHPLHRLQHTIGNQAVQRMIQAQAAAGNAGLTDTISPRSRPTFRENATHSPSPTALQAKLTINSPGDEYEQEADQVAEQVMRMPETQLQRTCTCGTCPTCQAQQPPEQQPLQMKRVRPGNPGLKVAPPVVDEVLRSPGQPLDAATRAFMEPRFGYDFSQVRVHTDPPARQSAQEVEAQAYTVGQNVVFAPGKFAPGTREGQQLLAHELTHVVQQSGTGTKTDAHVQRAPALNTGYKSGDEGWAGLVQAAVEALDTDEGGRALKDILLKAVDHKWLKLWALQLQAHLQSPYGNYLYLFFLKLRDYDQDVSAKYARLLAQDGVSISPVSGSFQSLDYLDPSVEAPVSPQAAGITWSRYVDNFATVKYDLAYKPNRRGALSEKLQVFYADGTKIDIDLADISDNLDPAWQNAIFQSYIGPGKRFFPSRMSRNTVPHLWTEKQKALAKMHEENQEFETFVSIGLAGVMSNLPIGPVGEPPLEAPTGGRSIQTPVAPEPAEPVATEAPQTTEEAPTTAKQQTQVPETGRPGNQKASARAVKSPEIIPEPATGLKPWRGKVKIPNGDLNGGWVHIDGRHVTGNHPDGPGDLFAPGTTRAQLEKAANEIVRSGYRMRQNPLQRMQLFQKVISVNGKTEMVRVYVDTRRAEVITIFPPRSE